MSSSSPPDDTPSSTNPGASSTKSSSATANDSDASSSSSTSKSASSSFSLFPLISQFRLKPSDIYLKLMKKAAEATGRPIGGSDDKLVVSDELVNTVADRAADYILGRSGGVDDSNGDSKEDADPAKNSPETSSLDTTSVSNSSSSAVGDDDDIRNVGLYKIALDAIKYQRDGYIMGTDYALKNADYIRTLRKQDEELKKRMEEEEKEKEKKRKENVAVWGEGKDDFGSLLPESIAPLFQDIKAAHQHHQQQQIITPLIPPPPNPILDPNNSYGKAQLVDLGKWFIPSPTVYNALKPTVLWLCSSEGPLHQPALQSTLNTITSSQDNLNWVMKSNIMWFLQDDAFRNRVKGITRGYIHDGGSNSGGGGENDKDKENDIGNGKKKG